MELAGGDFGSGFASGAVSSLVSSGVQGLGMSGGGSPINLDKVTGTMRQP